MRRVVFAASVALITLGMSGLLADHSRALPLSDPRVHNLAIAVSPIQKYGVAAGGNGTELVGYEAVGPLVMIRAGTPVAAALQRRTTRIGALGEDRRPSGIGSTDRPRGSFASEKSPHRFQLPHWEVDQFKPPDYLWIGRDGVPGFWRGSDHGSLCC